MAAVTAPVDGRAQYSLAAVAMANHSLDRWPFAGVQEIFPAAMSGLEKQSVPTSLPQPRRKFSADDLPERPVNSS